MECAGARMKDQLQIEYPDPYSLIVKKNRAGGLRNMVGTLVFFGVWYGFLFGPALAELWRRGELLSVLFNPDAWSILGEIVTRENPCLWLFIVGPLFALPQLLRAMKIALFGEVIHFNGQDKSITKDDRQRALFADGRGVEIRTVVDSDGPDDHRISVLLNDGSSFFVTESSDYEEMANLAGDIARVLNTGVVKG